MSELKDFGLQYVNPDLVEVSPPVKDGWESTKDGGGGTSREDIRSGITHTSEVKSLIDKGYSDKDFDRMRQSSDPQEKAVGDSHEMLWGERPISVNRDGDHFVIGQDGRHRVDQAQAQGEKSIPMRVHAPADDPEFSRRSYDEARGKGYVEPRRDSEMSNEAGRSNPEHNPIETPEVSKSPERPHVDGDTPAQHKLRDDETGGPDYSFPGSERESPGGAQDSPNTSADTKDPMDGADEKQASDNHDAMDGLEDKGKAAEHAGKELPDFESRGHGG